MTLHDDHPLSETHHLVEHTNEERGECHSHLVPRVVGSYIPREKTGRRWQLFVLAHFMPFSHTDPFITGVDTLEQVFKKFELSAHGLFVTNNWEAVHECQDERDSECLRKRAALTAESLAMTKALGEINQFT